MQKKLRIRRLTLAPKPLSAIAVSNDNLMIEADRILDYERHHRDMELVVASSSRSKPHVHGKEIGRNNRLWAGSYASDSDSEIDGPVIVPDNDMLLTVPSVSSAEKDVKGELGTYPVKAFAHHNDVKQVNSNDSHMKPWEGPLPSRRVSPQLAFHHVLEKALTCRDSSRSVPSVHREKCVQDGCTLSGASVSAKIGNIIQKKRIQREVPCWARPAATFLGPLPNKVPPLQVGPHVPFRPTPGLVTLFARTGTKPCSSRAPFVRKGCVPFASFAEVLKAATAMEGNNGIRGRGAGQGSGLGNGSFRGRGAGQGPFSGRNGNGMGRGFVGGHASVPGHGGDRWDLGRGRQFHRGGEHFNNVGPNRFPGNNRGGGWSHANNRARWGDDLRAGQRSLQGDVASFSSGQGYGSAVSKVEGSSSGPPMAGPSAEALAQAVALINHALAKPAPETAPDVKPVPLGSQFLSDAKGKNVMQGKGDGDQGVVGDLFGKGGGKEKAPYCWRCLTKGHTMQVCTADLWCDICQAPSHNTERCQKFRGTKPAALTAGYAVDGLGFFYIPHTSSTKQPADSRLASIKIDGGCLSVPQVVAELERLESYD